ncbi:hypothetical protein [Jiangella rhizosphaerae]|uniref:Uncharacterized protein n=1 Tax=Jiangella rhizosphaerae TaxID=2293569 RepID=A0A418KL66_9ACTN|nr:hypothetical protein [Jiangella rhizosphaerae]RIQ18265.1 hypothetical protein DY240_21870 [Jiangella rhizosphaerae]
MNGLTVLSLFSGIGGIDLGLERARRGREGSRMIRIRVTGSREECEAASELLADVLDVLRSTGPVLFRSNAVPPEYSVNLAARIRP